MDGLGGMLAAPGCGIGARAKLICVLNAKPILV